MRLDDLAQGMRVSGIVPGASVTVVAVERYGDGGPVLVTFRDPEGKTSERYLYPADEPSLELETTGGVLPFDGDGAELRLASEALRIQNAHLFDPYLAVNTSLVEPLPHQLMAVYRAMLPRQPLRFLLADDPGAGKTIMAGLLIRELQARSDLVRCLVVCPGALAGQWQDELYDKFHMDFDIVTPQEIETSPGGNPFRRHPLVICRLDQLSRNEEFQELLEDPELHWDLVVVDEAHKMSAHYWGNKLEKTKRYQLGERLRSIGRHFLLMTATPHNGQDEDFQLFMALLDRDRFEGKFRPRDHAPDYHDLMLRRVKEELVWPDGRPLFTKRLAYTVAYGLSPAEQELYDAVTHYVREEMNRAERVLDDSKKNVVGFALTVLQRRLASSPAAIHLSLGRRRARLEKRLQEIGEAPRAEDLPRDRDLDRYAGRLSDPEELEDLPEDEAFEMEEELLDRATAARTMEELRQEIATLEELEAMSRRLLASQTDAKWNQLRDLLQDRERMFDAAGHRRKLIVFTEHRDTLEYLADRIRTLFGRPEAVVTIRGGMGRDERRRVQERFLQDSGVQILVATDAAGEGVNLQRAHLMINYDLPWNPNRLEQRFGRIHRIGQTEVCHCWNLVAEGTREGDVYLRLFRKLQAEHEALDGKVFDVLGKAFSETSLKDLLMEAIRYGDDPRRREELETRLDTLVDPEHLQELRRDILAHDVLATADVDAIREELERAAARRLQPHHIQAFFLEAFARLHGRVHQRERGRFEITRVPVEIRQRAQAAGRCQPLLNRYERITFDKEAVRVPGKPPAELVAPGHPLLDLTVAEVLERSRELFTRGAVLLDETDAGTEARILVTMEHEVTDGTDRVVSRRLQFTEMSPDGTTRDAGPAPYLDYRPLTPQESIAVSPLLEEKRWLGQDLERQAITHAALSLVEPHLEEVRRRVVSRVERTERAVRERLTLEITHWDRRAEELREEMREGREQRMNWEHAQRRARELEQRLKARLAELKTERDLRARRPVVRGMALIIPRGFLDRALDPEGQPQPDTFARDRDLVERLAVDAVLAAERAAGREPREMPHANPGYDVESRDPATGTLLFIEVKGRVAGARTVTLTRTEILTGLNRPDTWILALVEVEDGRATEPRYLQRITDREPGFAETSVNFDLGRLLAHAVRPSELHPGGAS